VAAAILKAGAGASSGLVRRGSFWQLSGNGGHGVAQVSQGLPKKFCGRETTQRVQNKKVYKRTQSHFWNYRMNVIDNKGLILELRPNKKRRRSSAFSRISGRRAWLKHAPRGAPKSLPSIGKAAHHFWDRRTSGVPGRRVFAGRSRGSDG
jgi:hypothetical protein